MSETDSEPEPESAADPEPETEVPEELAAAVAENPEAVAEFVRRLGLVNELLDVAALGTDAMDDEMVGSLADTAGTLGESADAAATDETARLAGAVGEHGEDLGDAVETVAELQRTGTLDRLVELGDVVALATDAADDEMITSLAGTAGSLGELADEAADPDTVRGARTLVRAVGDAGGTDEFAEVGPVGLVRALRDPEVKKGMAFLVALARGLGRELDREET